jgi:hypothetical protein
MFRTTSHRQLAHRALLAMSALALLGGASALASSTALAAGPVQVRAVSPGAARPAGPIWLQPTGTYDCGTPAPVSGTITWSPPSGVGSTPSTIRFSWNAANCKIISGPLAGQIIRRVHVTAAFPVYPNSCPFLAQNYIENLAITYPGINGPYHVRSYTHRYRFRPSYATVALHPAAFWTLTNGLVSGSFWSLKAAAQVRPVIASGVCNSSVGVSVMKLNPTSTNILTNF